MAIKMQPCLPCRLQGEIAAWCCLQASRDQGGGDEATGRRQEQV